MTRPYKDPVTALGATLHPARTDWVSFNHLPEPAPRRNVDTPRPARPAMQVWQSDAVKMQSPDTRAAIKQGHDPRNLETRAYDAARTNAAYDALAYDMRRNGRDKVKVR